jgi:aspartate kinase
MPETFARTRESLLPLIEEGVIPVVGGFIGATARGNVTTLGRGGSDYTAAIVGAALRSEEIQIWTDVSGVLTADPRVVPEAQTIERLSYSEAAELAYFGAKVLHPKTIQPAIEDRIPVRICNSRAPEERGTLVGPDTDTSPRTIKAIAHKKGVTTVQITSARMLGAYGFLRALFEVFERHRTVVDVVTTSEVSVSLSLDDDSALPLIVTELEQLGTVRVEKKCAIICVVGEGLRGTPGIAARVFSTISDINVTLISQGASSINFTFAIEETRVEEAVRRLHKSGCSRRHATSDGRRHLYSHSVDRGALFCGRAHIWRPHELLASPRRAFPRGRAHRRHHQSAWPGDPVFEIPGRPASNPQPGYDVAGQPQHPVYTC